MYVGCENSRRGCFFPNRIHASNNLITFIADSPMSPPLRPEAYLAEVRAYPKFIRLKWLVRGVSKLAVIVNLE
jgi:hypothetical protein